MRTATKKDYKSINEKTVRFADAIRDKITYADLKDHGGHAVIRMRWGMNKHVERDHIFLMEINGQKAYLDLEEFMSYSRLM